MQSWEIKVILIKTGDQDAGLRDSNSAEISQAVISDLLKDCVSFLKDLGKA